MTLKSCSSGFFPELCGVNVTVDPQGRTGTQDDRVLILAQIGAGASVLAGSIALAMAGNVAALFGANSMAANMVTEFLERCPTAEVSVYAVANDLDVSTSTVTFTPDAVDTSACNGTIYLWVNGQVYQVPFNNETETGTDIASKFQAVISATDLTLAVTAVDEVLTISTVGTGQIGGFLDIRASYGLRPDLVTECRVDVAVANTAVAVGLPDLSALEALGDGYEFVLNPFTNDAVIANLDTYLCGQWSGGANSRAFGVFYGDATEAATFGRNANNALISYMAIGGALTPPYLETADFGCLAYSQLNCASADVAASMTGSTMPSLMAPELVDRYTDAEKANLVEDGMGYFNVNRVNAVSIGRAVTTFTTDGSGSIDISLREINAPSVIACVSKFLRDQITARFTGYSFRTDGVTPSGTSNVATLGGIRNYISTLGQTLSDRNLIQDLPQFVQSVQLSVGEDNCIGVVIDPTLVGQFCCMNITLRTIS